MLIRECFMSKNICVELFDFPIFSVVVEIGLADPNKFKFVFPRFADTSFVVYGGDGAREIISASALPSFGRHMEAASLAPAPR